LIRILSGLLSDRLLEILEQLFSLPKRVEMSCDWCHHILQQRLQMRIMYISSALTFGGGERHLVDLARVMSARRSL